MGSKSTKQHQKESSSNLSCGIITLSDSRKSKVEDLSGQFLTEELEKKYQVSSRVIIPDEKEELIKAIENMIALNIDVILTTGGTGLSNRDITV